MRLVVKRLKMLKDVELEGEKVVLFGPNGSGKSTLIHFLMLTLSLLGDRPHYSQNVLPQQVLREAEAVVYLSEERIEVSKGHLAFRGISTPLTAGGGLRVYGWVIWHVDEWKAVQLGQVGRCGSVFEGYEVRFEEGFAVSCPWVARGLGDVYYNYAYDPDLEWVPIANLSYGQKRRLAIEAALTTGNYVFIENFESGLHVDYLKDLVEEVAESKAVVVVETHSGMVLKLAKQYGFSPYYVDAGEVKKIERLDDAELFKRELAAYQL